MKDFSQRIANLSPKRLMLLATELRAQLDKLERKNREPIAIVGIGCRFPGGDDDPETYWRLLKSGMDAVKEIPPQRWDVDAYYDKDVRAPGKVSTRWAGLIDRSDEFDATFFGIAPREALTMDPQQRILLEVAWEALERAGISPGKLAGTRTGVYIGISSNDYYHLLLSTGKANIDAYFASGNALSVASGRLSYVLGLKGPCLSVDTACSSSLVSIHLAVQALKNGECETALAGGVNLALNPEITIALSKAEMMAPDGRCKAFDARADGFVRGEGCGVIVLKRLSDAIRDEDNILALIRGSAINQDGKSHGLTAPNGPSQEEVIRAALANGGVKPEEVDYVEAHGTGTALGDPIEVRALGAVFCRERTHERPLRIGSVKSNIGHLESAAGVAGLIKVVLALQNDEIPPSLHFETPNPHIEWDQLPIHVSTGNSPWPASERRRIAGVSSFGFSGTNAHVVLEEAPPRRQAAAVMERPVHLLTLSAKSEGALRELTERYMRNLMDIREGSIGDVCFTAGTGRAHFNHRLAVVGQSREQFLERLAAFSADGTAVELHTGRCKGATPPDVVFLCTGQGSQYIEMGRSLYETQPHFRATLERCDAILAPYLEKPLLSVLYPSADQRAQSETLLNQTGYTQPVLFSIDYALAELWRSWGVEPAVIMGHSLGEFVAACVAGVFSLEDGLKLVAERGRLMQMMPAGGSMAAVFADQTLVARAIASFVGSVSIAAVNGPDSTVISGASPDLEIILQDLANRGIDFRRLTVSHAFHSPLMERALDAFEKVAAAIRYSPPSIEVIANVTGKPSEAEDLTTPAYWRRHARQPVQFLASIEHLYAAGHRIFVEVGPSPILTGMAARFVSDADTVWLPSLRQGQNDWAQMLGTLGALYVRGTSIDWEAPNQGRPRRRVLLPTYPFQRKRYWIEPSQRPEPETAPSGAEPWRDWLYELKWEPGTFEGSREVGRPEQCQESVEQVNRGCWLLLVDEGGAGQKLAEVIRSRGYTCLTAAKGASFKEVREGHFHINPQDPEDYKRCIATATETAHAPCLGVVHFWALDETISSTNDISSLDRSQQNICGSALYLTQALAVRETESPLRLYLVTRGVQPIGSTADATGVAQTTLWGLGKVVMLEHPELHCICVDLDPRPAETEMRQLFDDVLSATAEEHQVALRHDQWWVPRVAPRNFGVSPYDGQPFRFRSDGVYLITGGLAGLGLHLARWLVEKGARHLVLMSRSGASEAADETIVKIRQMGAEVMIARGDVAEPEHVTRAMEAIANDRTPLRGIFHCAGTLDDGILLQQNWDRFRKVMAAKVLGAWNLHVLTRKRPLDCFVLFSSGAAMLGSPGQGNYAAANAFLDGMAHYRRRQGLPALSVDWGAWNKVGMASRRGVVARMQARGHGVIEPEQGLTILEHLLSMDVAQVGVLPIHWSALLDNFRGRSEMRLLERLYREIPETPKTAEPAHRDSLFSQQLIKAPAGKRRNLLQAMIHGEAALALGLRPTEQIDAYQPLTELGLDSLMAVQLRNALSSLVDRPLPATLLFNYPSVDQLVSYLEGALQSSQEVQVAPMPGASDTRSPAARDESTGEGLDKLSEDEMVHLLASKLREL